MNARCLYIIMCIVSLLFLTDCKDEEAVRSSEGKRTITVNLGIAMSRVNLDDTDLGKGTPSDMKVWIFEHDTDNRLAYLPEDKPVFSGSDALGGLVNTKEYVVEVDNSIQALDFYVVLNSGNGTDLDLDENSTPSKIKEATFTGISTGLEDNQVPAYGFLEGFDVSEHKNTYTVPSIKLTRAVGKLELFFTKENASSSLTITKVEITQGMPDKGYLSAVPADDNRTYTNPNPSVVLFESGQEQDGMITQFLPEEEGAFGDFSSHEDRFRSLLVSYLLENPNGETWDDEKHDWTYPETPQGTSLCYKVVVSYQLNGKDEQGEMYLSEIERNVWNKIFVRVKDKGELQIRYKAMPWEVVESSIGYAPQPMTENPFSNEDEYNEFIKNGESKYILLPLENYRVETKDGKVVNDYSNTQKLFNHLYENPEVGDNEARLCIITRPTYDDSVDKEEENEHWTLKPGSAGARYYFMLTGPEGATWEARLNDPDGNFAFSTSVDDDSFANCTDNDFAKEVRMVTHGIARKQPYIIQIIATHLYSGNRKDPRWSGISDKDTEPRFEDEYDYNVDANKDDWKPYFTDEYLTDWGLAREKEGKETGKVVEAEFYITVKLADGTEYDLAINPPYYPEKDDEKKKYPFYNKETKTYHRFAGTETRIWIRQVRAQYDWPNLEYLARDLQTEESGNNPWNKPYWWTKNPYWNPDHTYDVWH